LKKKYSSKLNLEVSLPQNFSHLENQATKEVPLGPSQQASGFWLSKKKVKAHFQWLKAILKKVTTVIKVYN
jgi:hypothetical protein